MKSDKSLDNRDRLLTPGEVAALFRVDPKTVTRWAKAGRLESVATPGGHRRFRESLVRELLGEPIEARTAALIVGSTAGDVLARPGTRPVA